MARPASIEVEGSRRPGGHRDGHGGGGGLAVRGEIGLLQIWVGQLGIYSQGAEWGWVGDSVDGKLRKKRSVGSFG